MIRITSQKDGFRRGGMAHPKGSQEYPDGSFSKGQLADLQAEPMLIVTIVPDPPATEPKEPGKGSRCKKE